MGDPKILANCHVVDGHGAGVHRDQYVLVRDGKIAEMGPLGAAGARGDAARGDVAVIDLRGSYLMAGLFNMHTHFSLALPGPLGDSVRAMSPHELMLYVADGARRTLRSGVTSVRCVGESDHAEFALRAAIEAGRAEGPRIFSAGRALVCTGGHGHEAPSALECDGPDGFARGARAQIKAGADLIKVMISGGIAGANETIETMPLTPGELEAVIATAHAWGRKVTAHAGPARVIEQDFEVGHRASCEQQSTRFGEPACDFRRAGHACAVGSDSGVGVHLTINLGNQKERGAGFERLEETGPAPDGVEAIELVPDGLRALSHFIG